MNKDKYEKMYELLLDYEKTVHEKNQKRIRNGLICIWVIPLIFLALLFWTGSSKIIFLILWIVSLFMIAAYLIFVEYMDYKLQEKLHELDDDTKVSNLVVGDIDKVEHVLRKTITKINNGLNAEEDFRYLSEEKDESHIQESEDEFAEEVFEKEKIYAYKYGELELEQEEDLDMTELIDSLQDEESEKNNLH